MDVVVKSNVSKRLYKYEIILLKTIPYILSFCYITNTVLSYFGIEIELFSMLSGISVIPFIFLLVSSFVFKFCKYHRMMIYYIGITELLAWIDYYHKIPISNNTYFILLFIIFGIFLFFTAYYKVKNK